LAWSDPVIAYCERLDHAFWAEPINALTNFAFVVAGVAILIENGRRARPDAGQGSLAATTVLIGCGSFLFHTLATRWAALLDILPIAVFIHLYMFLALRRFVGLEAWVCGAAVAAFLALSQATAYLAGGALHGSIGYLPALVALAAVAAAARAPADRGALLSAAALFFVSLMLRTADRAVCPALPIGTHFLWHLLNALLLWRLMRAIVRPVEAAPTRGTN
jgi:hypothetical protein